MYSVLRLASLVALMGEGMAQVLTAPQVNNAANNTLFPNWRPKSHFIAPAGWMNDPCGAMYDPKTQTYHLMYQWHPNHINWGNISWGHATSKDMITWEDVGGWQGDQALALGPTGSGDGHYDGLGVFSGTGHPVNLKGEQNGTLTIFYTSVSKLPTNWKIPYQNGTESQSVATSDDGGKTWNRYEKNPIFSQPPPGWNITGWRDPFVLPWPQMDSLLGNSEPHWYAVLGSGIKEVGPRMPFYSAPASDLTNWTYHGPLWEPKANSSLGDVNETGSYGFNFEVSGFFSLKDSAGKDHFYVNMGTEGGAVPFHDNDHWALWNEGVVTKTDNGSVHFEPKAGGAGDWGLLYALTSFDDTKNNRRVQWGWLPEDLGDNLFSAKQQGFQGSLALPRELFVKETNDVNVTDAETKTPGNSWYEAGDYGRYKAYTLGVRPLPDVVKGLRSDAKHWTGQDGKYKKSKIFDTKGSRRVQMSARFENAQGQVGFIVAASPSFEEQTLVHFDPATNAVTVDRSNSSQIKQFNSAPQYGHFKPYMMGDSGKPEAIDMTVFLDGSALEVYINERFALSTRIYPARKESKAYGIYVGKSASADVSQINVWKGLKNVFPDRPRDSSSDLEYDTPEETNNYLWWPGN
jgi:beta-fructofuranosidase